MSLHRTLSRAVLSKQILPFPGKTAVANVDKRNVMMSTPPLKKISSAEKIIMGVVLTSSICFIPAWVLYHVPEYQGERGPKKAT